VPIGSASGHGAVAARATSPCCLAVGLAVHEIVGPAAKVHEVAALAERGRAAFEMDAYAMSCAVMFAQVRTPAVTYLSLPTHALAPALTRAPATDPTSTWPGRSHQTLD